MTETMSQREALIHVILNGNVQQVRDFAANCTKVASFEHLRVYCQMLADAIGEFEGSSRLALNENQKRNLRIFTTAIFATETVNQLDQRFYVRRSRRNAQSRRRFAANRG